MLNKERPEVVDALIEWISNGRYSIEHFKKETGFTGDFLNSKEVKSWLNSEYVEPYEITQAEKTILESLPKGFEWIARDYNEELNVYEEEPVKNAFEEFHSTSGKFESMALFKHLFRFVDSKNSLKISDILENCVIK